MVLRSTIIDVFKSYLVDNTSAFSTSPGYINDVNDFPSIAILIPRETRFHIGGFVEPGGLTNQKTITQFSITVRGYVLGPDGEDSMDSSEKLANEIDTAVASFDGSSLAKSMGVYSARVNSLSTDEGLLTPYGITDLEVLFETFTCS